ncbi:unnamed protein product [Rotaria sp. Silwood1]|nr:unnamed protein product [Rotaria sp. Silwood1]CAF4649978.1 unnamed protein product [Rotaria sp. Silwood1]
MAIVSLNDRENIHDMDAIGTFDSISIYCILHTILIIYLFIYRSKASEHSKRITFASIPEYIAAGTPFLYFLAFAAQFWTQTKQMMDSTFTVHYSNRRET